MRLAALVFLASAHLHAESRAAKRWWSHVVYLADDKLMGRETGSAGHKQAARYVAAEFERAGLKAAGTNSYFQPVRFRSQRIDESASSLELRAGGEWKPLALGKEVYFNTRASLVPEMEADLVFAGYGFTVPERQYDEFAGLDLRGRIVVYLNGGPRNLPAALMSHYQSADERWKRAKALGAVGLASITTPRASDTGWARASTARLMPALRLTEIAGDNPPMGFSINAAGAADRFLDGSTHDMSAILELANAGKPLPKFELKTRVRARTRLETAELESDNVLGLLPGRDPARSQEVIVVSAHLDHIGSGTGTPRDSIFNGAMDNASGIALMIEMARALRKRPPARRVLFAAVTGEEKGLLGSRYFAHAPSIPREGIVANLNFDMFLPLFPLRGIIVYGMDESTLGDTARRVIEKRGLIAMADPQPARNSFIRSDQYSFIRRGIPALAFKFGYVLDSPESMVFQRWLSERYHSVADDTSQPLDREAAAQFVDVMTAIVADAANEPQRPGWKPSSIFGRYAAN